MQHSNKTKHQHISRLMSGNFRLEIFLRDRLAMMDQSGDHCTLLINSLPPFFANMSRIMFRNFVQNVDVGILSRHPEGNQRSTYENILNVDETLRDVEHVARNYLSLYHLVSKY